MAIFRLSFTSEEILFDPNLELKFQISQFLGKCFENNLREKLAFWTYLEQKYFFGREISKYLILILVWIK
jgi:hypothetical protein